MQETQEMQFQSLGWEDLEKIDKDVMTKDLGLRQWLPWGQECSSLLTPSYLGFALLSNLVFPLFLHY